MSGKPSSSTLTTMGELSLNPPDGDKKSHTAVVDLVRKYYPPDWENWEVNNLPSEKIFGSSISPEVEKKIRFALPTLELLQAVYPDAKDASERKFRDLKRRLLSWPFGRTLLYTPHNIMAQIHTKSQDTFMETVNKLKPHILSRQSAGERLKSDLEPSPTATTSPTSKKKRISKSPVQHETPKRTRSSTASPSPLSEQGEHLLSLLLEQQHRQNAMFEHIIKSNKRNENTIKKLEETITSHAEEPTTDEDPSKEPPGELDISFADSTQSGEEDEESGDIGRSVWAPMAETVSNERKDGSTSDAVEILRNQIAEAQRKLLEIQQNSACIAECPDNNTVDFAPAVTESQVKVVKADETLAKLGAECQRFCKDTWKNIRYSEVQKQFQATPVFTALKVNSHLALATPFWHSVSLLEKFDGTLAAISHGLLQQRKIFQDFCQNLSPELKSQINTELLGPDAKFRKTSDAILQFICGRRSEVISQRRQLYKAPNKAMNEVLHDIPPSGSHLFSEKELSELVKDQGGLHKLFPNKNKKVTNPKQSIPKQGQNNYKKPQAYRETFRKNNRRDERKPFKLQSTNNTKKVGKPSSRKF
ncbi:hypothetical protein NE865_00461 [Phthorimaea operculella]|nr:hypothetical protein NE865_00461 [Phthorimaea operculella]